MHEVLLHALRRHRATLRARWETLLRAEPACSPLANPDVLVLMMEWTLDEWENAMRHQPSRRRRAHSLPDTPSEECPCGMNPLLRYFSTAETALDEALTILPIPTGEGEAAIFAREAFVADAKRALKVVAGREIATFCAVCQQRRSIPLGAVAAEART
ncbi:MAG: hypothetical protein U1F61_08305 [Opitutaceae bacterium]